MSTKLENKPHAPNERPAVAGGGRWLRNTVCQKLRTQPSTNSVSVTDATITH